MDDRTLWHFRREIEFQSAVALRAFEQLDLCFHQVDDSLGVRVFANIHGMLSATAAISRLLFSQKNAERAKTLRERFGVSDDSILRSRGRRNHFEHFDERLDEWLPKTADGSVIDMVASTTRLEEEGPRYELRMFNVTTFEVTFADETTSLRPLAAAVKALVDS